MRRILDALYRGSGALAALFLAAICGVVLLQVGANLIDKVAGWVTGTPIGLVIPSYAEFAGFFLAATSFFALAYTFRSGSHIRVTLIIQNATGRRRRAVELWAVFGAGCVSGYFAFYTGLLVLESLRFGDVSIGMAPVPLWIPQLALFLGLAVLTVALVDEYFAILRGAEPSYEANAEAGDGGPRWDRAAADG